MPRPDPRTGAPPDGGVGDLARRLRREGAVPEPPISGLAALLGGRWGLHPAAGVAALVLVAAVVVVLLLRGVGPATATPVPDPGVAVPLRGLAAASASGAVSRAGATAARTPAAATSSAATSPAPAVAPSTASPTAVVVDVAGQVASPGVVRLPAGSRVADALAAAGGALARADLARVNRARVLVDGEQVLVPSPGQPLVPAAPPAAAAALPTARAAGGAGATVATPAGPVDLNTATEAELDALPGVGPVMAQRILDWRAAHGRFASTDELGEVSGVGPATLARLLPLVVV